MRVTKLPEDLRRLNDQLTDLTNNTRNLTNLQQTAQGQIASLNKVAAQRNPTTINNIVFSWDGTSTISWTKGFIQAIDKTNYPVTAGSRAGFAPNTTYWFVWNPNQKVMAINANLQAIAANKNNIILAQGTTLGLGSSGTIGGGGTLSGGSGGSGGGGTVASVGLSMPVEFTETGTPITSVGTITVTKANQAANTIWAGPTSGSPAAPTFRALVAADIPSSVPGTVNSTGLGANVSTSTLYAVPSGKNGLYRISIFIVVTRAATTSSILPQVDITWTGQDTGLVVTEYSVTPSNNANTLGAYQQATFVVNAAANTNIQYATENFATSGATSMQYALRLRAEYLL